MIERLRRGNPQNDLNRTKTQMQYQHRVKKETSNGVELQKVIHSLDVEILELKKHVESLDLCNEMWSFDYSIISFYHHVCDH